MRQELKAEQLLPMLPYKRVFFFKYGDVTASTGEECSRQRVELLGMLVNLAKNCANANDYAYAMAA